MTIFFTSYPDDLLKLYFVTVLNVCFRCFAKFVLRDCIFTSTSDAFLKTVPLCLCILYLYCRCLRRLYFATLFFTSVLDAQASLYS